MLTKLVDGITIVMSPEEEAEILSERASRAPTLEQLKAGKLANFSQQCTDALAQVKAGYPDDEVQSWGKQEAEARAFSANVDAPIPLLTAIATTRQVPVDLLASKVIAKADLFAAASGEIIGMRQRCEDQVNSAENADAVNAVVWVSNT